MSASVRAVPRASRVLRQVRARGSSPAIEKVVLAEVLDRFGLGATGRARNLGDGRRSRNVAVATDRGAKVVKRYRRSWDEATIAYGHQILLRLEEVGAAAPHLVRSPDGMTQVAVGEDRFAVFDRLDGTVYASTHLRRSDRLRLMTLAGRTLADWHQALDGFEPAGQHHMGFVSLQGPRSRDLGWFAEVVGERLRERPIEGTERLVAEAPAMLESIALLDGALGALDLPRRVIHGDFGLHNLLIDDDRATPIDVELARVDWRLTDLLLVLGKHLGTDGHLDVDALAAFMDAYLEREPMTVVERSALPEAWRYQQLTSAIRSWASAAQAVEAAPRVAAATAALERAGWAASHAEIVDRLFGPAAQVPVPAQAEPAHTVLLVLPALDIGGAQETALTLTRHLPGAGWKAAVATFHDGPMRADFEAAGVPVDVLADRRHRVIALPWFVADIVRMRRALIRAARRSGAEVVQIQTLGTVAFVVASLRIGGHARVFWRVANVTLPGDGSPGTGAAVKRLGHRRLYRLGARTIDGVIAVSDQVADAFRAQTGSRSARVSVVLNGVDTDRYPAAGDRDAMRERLGFGTDAHLMTMVGTFKEQKGHRFLIDAVADVMPGFPGLHLLLVGEGTLEVAVRAQVELAGLVDRVHLLGSRRDVDRILQASDSFVLPSLWEGFSVALVEAMASRLPVIATAVSGTTQVMRDGVTGWLVPPGDAASLAGAMKEVLSDPVAAALRGAAARERVEAGFSAQAQAERYAGLYEEAVGRR